MNSDEKILTILAEMQVEQRKTNERLDSIESTQAEMQKTQAEMQTDLREVKNRVIFIENEHGKRLDSLFDGYKQNYDMLQRLEKKVAAGDEVILRRVFPGK